MMKNIKYKTIKYILRDIPNSFTVLISLLYSTLPSLVLSTPPSPLLGIRTVSLSAWTSCLVPWAGSATLLSLAWNWQWIWALAHASISLAQERRKNPGGYLYDSDEYFRVMCWVVFCSCPDNMHLPIEKERNDC